MGNFIAILMERTTLKRMSSNQVSQLFRCQTVLILEQKTIRKFATVLFGIAGLVMNICKSFKNISIFCADVDNVVKLVDAQTEDEVVKLLSQVN